MLRKPGVRVVFIYSFKVPAVNVLSKVDILSHRNRELLETFLETDTRAVLSCEEVTPWNEKHRKLSEAIAEVINDYSLVSSSLVYHEQSPLCT